MTKEEKQEKQKAYDKARYQANLEEKKEYDKARYQANREDRKVQMKAWQEANLEKFREYNNKWYKANFEKKNAQNKAWQEANPEKVKEINKAWREANPDVNFTKSSKYRANNFNRLHPDHDQEEERRLYILAKNCEAIFNEPFHIDHILPYTCGGWHHHLNLQVIPARINSQKKNNPDYQSDWPNFKTWKDLPDFLLIDKSQLN